MHWYLVYTKPRQERCALQNLEQQGYECYLPIVACERVRQRDVVVQDEALFPRYLFIRLGLGGDAKSWAPVRSTKGVSQLVRFGSAPAEVSETLIAGLRAREASLSDEPRRLFQEGDRVRMNDGALAALEGVFQMSDGERRVMVLIELLSKPVSVRIPLQKLSKVR